MDQRDEEIVRTCEAAVTRLTEQGWEQDRFVAGDYWSGTDSGGREFHYSGASACLGGALVLAQFDKPKPVNIYSLMQACAAVAAVADTIRELPIERRRFVRVRERSDRDVVFSFNDRRGRTRQDVIDVLNDTIKRHNGGAA